MSAFAFRWYSAQTLKLRLFPEAHSRESCPGFLFLMLEASVRWSLRPKFSLLSILWVYDVHKYLYFGFLISFSYSFDQTTKSLDDFFFRPFCALIFLMLISVFASMSISLSSFQHLHKPYPILLPSECWRLASAYFYELHFPSGAVSGTQLKLVGSHLACSCFLQKIRELCFLSRQYCPFFCYHC